MHPSRKESLPRLFEFVMQEVWSAGGDGDGVVVFRKTPIAEVADAFEEWMKTQKWMSLYKRYDRTEHEVLFSDGSNENVHFVSKVVSDGYRSPWGQEIWLEIY